MTRQKPIEYIINEAYEDRHAGTFKTYEAAARAIKRNYQEDELDKLQPAIGAVYADGSVSYEF
jgi:hypothetical protein